MESLGILAILKIAADFGVLGLVIYLWWSDNRRYETILNQYKNDMNEQRQMYEKNVSLVKDYRNVAGDLKEVVIMVTQTMTTLTDEIRQNQYCPMMRIEKTKFIRKLDSPAFEEVAK